MSIATLVIGESGSGKSTSLRNMDAESTLLIQAVPKPLPFRQADWKPWDQESKTGSVYVTDNSALIAKIIQAAPKYGKKKIIIDDAQYIMANEFMRRSAEKSYDKFTEIGRNFWDVINAATYAPSDVRVYMLTHSQSDDQGKTKAKTIGRMLDEKITVEGLFTIVLRAFRKDGKYMFATQTSGMDTCKSPMGLFEEEAIDNDLAEIDRKICEYYGI